MCALRCENGMSAPMCACEIQFDLCVMYLGAHMSVNVPLWSCAPFLLKCNYSCVNRT